ncbi:uncharacterized protein E0L32_000423 [Thyridium curvatum]|uniref:Nephrocystin 3-like N-terminal domain-containing protein n=1 Tax=Thyridium curvatum TaxID=1093900 RepID=A0A507B9F8_9PEZI|nr:uncharacterized protein E0L32_000423 [Thyridium curvatum]TPX14029.1 hypothetical protein E0L32_000423 [Thyridium curvatum]
MRGSFGLVLPVLVAAVTICLSLWLHRSFAHPPPTSRRPVPQPELELPQDESVQSSEERQDVRPDHANPPSESKLQSEGPPHGPDTPSQGPDATPPLPPAKRGLTLRVRGVPLDWDIHRLQSFLAGQDPSIGPTIRSLALEVHGRSQTATATLQNSPAEHFRLIPLPESPNQSAQPQSLWLDDEFIDVTTLYAPPSQNHKVDIIAISGLGGHAFGSFKERNGDHMWLRDALPHHIDQGDSKPCTRVIIYGYKSSLPQSQSFQNLQDLATSFRASLLQLVSAATPKPIIFIAHSLGGLIVKQTLIALSKSTKDDDQKLLRAVYGIVFFGVPHDGMDISSLIPIVEDGPNRFLLESIGNINSAILSTQQQEFHKALGREGESEIICFYETRKSPTAVQIDGKWKMEGPPAVLVTKSSATHCRPWEDGLEHICAVDRTHSDMVKFRSQDSEYEKARILISGLARRALSVQLPTLSKSARDCLRSLDFPEIDKRSLDIDRNTKGTCQWLLKHKTYNDWAACHRGLLWIRGKPGSGKSTLLKYALKKVTETPKVESRTLVLSFFFHGRGTELQRTSFGFFRSLLCQILRQVPDVLSDLVDKFESRVREKGEPGEKWQWHANELWEFFESSLPAILQTRSIWLFVDALDEAGEHTARDLVQRFKSLLEQLPSTRLLFRICFACREYPILEGNCKMTINPGNENREDISTYVQARLSSSKRLGASTIPVLITNRADGVFMWARLVVDEILRLDSCGETLKKIEKKISSTLPDLDDVYRGFLQDLEDKPASLKLIQWICFAIRPLSLDELRWAMVIDPKCPHRSLQQCRDDDDYQVDNDSMERKLNHLSHGLVEVVSSSDMHFIQFIHQSVRDYFVNKGLATLTASLNPAETKLSVSDMVGTAHHELSRTCICYLDMEEISRSPINDHEVLISEFPLLHYATTSWIGHAVESDAKGISQDYLLDYFAWPSSTLLQLWASIYNVLEGYSWDCPKEKTLLIHVVSRYQLLGPLQVILQKSQDDINIDAEDASGRTPLSWAAENGHEAVIKLLLEKDAAVDIADEYGRTPLSWAVRNGHEAVVNLLLEKDAVVNITDPIGRTPLSWAARNGHEAVVNLLLEKDAVVNITDPIGRTPLSWAAEKGHKAVVNLLLEKDAVVNITDLIGRTPLSWAAENGHEAVVKLLESHIGGRIPSTSMMPHSDSTNLMAE